MKRRTLRSQFSGLRSQAIFAACALPASWLMSFQLPPRKLTPAHSRSFPERLAEWQGSLSNCGTLLKPNGRRCATASPSTKQRLCATTPRTRPGRALRAAHTYATTLGRLSDAYAVKAWNDTWPSFPSWLSQLKFLPSSADLLAT